MSYNDCLAECDRIREQQRVNLVVYEPGSEAMIHALKLIEADHAQCKQRCRIQYRVEVPGYGEYVPAKTLAARSFAGLGAPAVVIDKLWRLRIKLIRREVHEKLHPLI